jgi:ribose transport system permease protein
VSAETRDTVGATPGGAVPAEGTAVQVPKAPDAGAAREAGRPHRRVGLASLRGATDLVLRFQTAFGLVAVLVAGVVFSPIVKGQNVFLTLDNFADIIRSVSVSGILAVGMTFVIIAGGIDLSVGALLGFSGIVLATTMVSHRWALIPAIAATLVVGAVFGLVQGALSTALKIQPFIITLAGLQVALGLGEIVSGNKHIMIVAGRNAPSSFDVLGSKIPGSVVPVSVIIFLVVAAVGTLVLNTTRFGQHVFAVGGNARAARLSGINVKAVIIGTFVICGFTAALGGIAQAGQLNVAGSNQGAGLELTVIASVVIGGTSVMGGTGSVLGTVAGTLLLGVLQNILTLNTIDPSKQPVITGVIIVTAVVLQNLAARRSSP